MTGTAVPGPHGSASAHEGSELHELEAALRTEARWRALVRHSSDIMAVVGRDGRLQYATPASERILVYTGTGMVGTSMFDLVHPDDREWVTRAALERASRPGLGPRVVYRLRHA